MAIWPDWLRQYLDSLPRHPADYLEYPQEKRTMGDWLDAAWNYNPFKSLLGSDTNTNTPQEKKTDGKEDSPPAKRNSTNRSVTAIRPPERKPRVVTRRIVEEFGDDPGPNPGDNQPSGGGTPTVTPGKEERAPEGEQKPDATGGK